MNNSLPPALTPEEWKNTSAAHQNPQHEGYSFTVALFEDGVNVGDSWDMEGCHIPASARQATAALCLYNQSFGFTRKDVELLRSVEDTPDDDRGGWVLWDNDRAALLSLADRIAALLPPE